VPQSQQPRSVFLGGIPPAFQNEATLTAHLAPHGEVSSIKLPREPSTGLPRGFAFATMARAEDAARLVTLGRIELVPGVSVDVGPAAKEVGTKVGSVGPRHSQSTETERIVFLGGIPLTANERDIKSSVEAKHGSVVGVKMPRDASGQSRGFCFVTMQSSMDANRMIQRKHIEVSGRTVDVGPPARRGDRSGGSSISSVGASRASAGGGAMWQPPMGPWINAHGIPMMMGGSLPPPPAWNPSSDAGGYFGAMAPGAGYYGGAAAAAAAVAAAQQSPYRGSAGLYAASAGGRGFFGRGGGKGVGGRPAASSPPLPGSPPPPPPPVT